MRLSGWKLTAVAAGGSIIASLFLLQYGIFFFFLPLFFLPFLHLFRSNKKTCYTCGMRSGGNFCSQCGSKLYQS